MDKKGTKGIHLCTYAKREPYHVSRDYNKHMFTVIIYRTDNETGEQS